MTMETQRADTTVPNPTHDGSRGQTAIVRVQTYRPLWQVVSPFVVTLMFLQVIAAIPHR